MPFQSKSQRRACYAKKDPAWDCKEWGSKTLKDLSETVKQRALHRAVRAHKGKKQT